MVFKKSNIGPSRTASQSVWHVFAFHTVKLIRAYKLLHKVKCQCHLDSGNLTKRQEKLRRDERSGHEQHASKSGECVGSVNSSFESLSRAISLYSPNMSKHVASPCLLPTSSKILKLLAFVGITFWVLPFNRSDLMNWRVGLEHLAYAK